MSSRSSSFTINSNNNNNKWPSCAPRVLARLNWKRALAARGAAKSWREVGARSAGPNSFIQRSPSSPLTSRGQSLPGRSARGFQAAACGPSPLAPLGSRVQLRASSRARKWMQKTTTQSGRHATWTTPIARDTLARPPFAANSRSTCSHRYGSERASEQENCSRSLALFRPLAMIYVDFRRASAPIYLLPPAIWSRATWPSAFKRARRVL